MDRGTTPRPAQSERIGVVDTLKRATTATVRAIAGRDDVVVTYAAGNAAVKGVQARLPLPSHDVDSTELVRLRGNADAVALKLRFHDEQIHRRRRPNASDARAVYDAAEQARVQALGARRLSGIAANLAGILEQQCLHEGYQLATSADEVPLAQALALLAHERFTGTPLPAIAHHTADLWRQRIESAAGPHLAALGNCLTDQNAYAREVRKILAALDLETLDPASETEESQPEAGNPPSGYDGQKDSSPGSEGSQQHGGSSESTVDVMTGAGAGEPGEASPADPDSSMMPGPGADQPGGPARHAASDRDGSAPYRPYSTQFDQVLEATDLCEPDELV
ncbi:MAG: cobaltochelatase subunit CobT, partial [Alphaproteobacteria bacterium]|nr:cobaltochelatase subunit CobT [Alphaproteobacteria bacterium]